MYYIHVRPNLLASLVSGILAVLAGGGLFAGTEPQCSRPQQPADENSHNLFNYETTYTFQSDFKNPASGMAIHFMTTSATTIDF